MIGVVARADAAGELEFVVGLFAFVPDGEGRHRPGHQLAHQRDVQRRVDPARQEHAEWHVRYHAPGNRLLEQSRQLAHRLVLAQIRFGKQRRWIGAAIPPPCGVRVAAPVDGHAMAGRDLENATEHRQRRRRHDEREVMPEGGAIHLGRDVRMREEGADFRREQPLPRSCPGEVKRLDADTVPDQVDGRTMRLRRRPRTRTCRRSDRRNQGPSARTRGGASRCLNDRCANGTCRAPRAPGESPRGCRSRR